MTLRENFPEISLLCNILILESFSQESYVKQLTPVPYVRGMFFPFYAALPTVVLFISKERECDGLRTEARVNVSKGCMNKGNNVHLT